MQATGPTTDGEEPTDRDAYRKELGRLRKRQAVLLFKLGPGAPGADPDSADDELLVLLPLQTDAADRPGPDVVDEVAESEGSQDQQRATAHWE